MVPESVLLKSNSIILTQYPKNKPLICEPTFVFLMDFHFTRGKNGFTRQVKSFTRKI